MHTDNPAITYLTRWPKSSDTYRTMRTSLLTVAKALGGEGADFVTFPWAEVRYAQAVTAAAKLQDLKLSVATVNKCLVAFRGVLRVAWLLGQIPDEEYRRFEIRKVRGSALPAGRVIEGEELDRLMEAVGQMSTRDAALVAVMYACGLRRIEVVRLRLRDYDFEHHRLRALGKGGKERFAPVSPDWRKVIKRHLAQLSGPNSVMFTSARGTPLTRDGVSFVLRKLIEKFALESFTPHDLRRTFITSVLEKADVLTAQRLAGHADANTTGIYDRRGESAATEAVKSLAKPSGRTTRPKTTRKPAKKTTKRKGKRR